MTGRVHHFKTQFSRIVGFAVFEQKIELAAIDGEFAVEIEQSFKDILNLIDMFADGHFCLR